MALTSVASVLASSGFWAYMQRKDTAKSDTTKLLMGLAYDRITYLGLGYIDRGWITRDEYEDLQRYFFSPYKSLGGNGTAERIMADVSRLPFRTRNPGVFRSTQPEEPTNVRLHLAAADRQAPGE